MAVCLSVKEILTCSAPQSVTQMHLTWQHAEVQVVTSEQMSQERFYISSIFLRINEISL